MQAFLHGGRSLTILENLWRGLLGILKTSLYPKDQRNYSYHFLNGVRIRVRKLKNPPGDFDFSTTRTATIAEKWHQGMKLLIKLTMTKSSEQGKYNF